MSGSTIIIKNSGDGGTIIAPQAIKETLVGPCAVKETGLEPCAIKETIISPRKITLI